jgi:hypothetical protein
MGRHKNVPAIEKFRANCEQVTKLLHLHSEFLSERERGLRSERKKKLCECLHLSDRKTELDVAHREEWKYYVIVNRTRGGDVDLFTADGLSVLLRQAVVAIVSCMDGYFRDKFKDVAYRRVSSAIAAGDTLPVWERELPFGELANIREYKRTGFVVQRILAHMAAGATFQAPDAIAGFMRDIGIKNLWGCVRDKLPDALKKRYAGGQALSKAILTVTDRRNRIAHDADRVETRPSSIDSEEVGEWIVLITEAVEAADKAIDEAKVVLRSGRQV